MKLTQILINAVREIRKWWHHLHDVPSPDAPNVFFERTGMDLYTATVIIPALRQDEADYSKNVSVIINRRFTHSVDGGEVVTQIVNLNQGTVDIPDVPDGSTLHTTLENHTDDDRYSIPTPRDFVAPHVVPEKPPVPAPNAVDVTWAKQ